MILLVNGPNLNLLGEREPEVYGSTTLAEVEAMVEQTCGQFGLQTKAFQSNSEGAILDFIQAHRHEARGIIVNPGALTHTSYALHDCLKSVRATAVEVHLSNVHAREEWRRRSVVAPAVAGQIAGLGVYGYWLAALWLCQQITGAAQPVRPAEAGERPAAVPEAAAPAASGEADPRTWPGPPDADLPQFGGRPEEIPVDVTKRGEYEPL